MIRLTYLAAQRPGVNLGLRAYPVVVSSSLTDVRVGRRSSSGRALERSAKYNNQSKNPLIVY